MNLPYSLRVQALLQFPLIRNSQLLTALCTAACQYFAAIGCLHALAETMNGFTAAAMRLKCTFHCFSFFTFILPKGGIWK